MKKYTHKELRDKLDKNYKWLLRKSGGERAILCGADLGAANLCDAVLRKVDLSGAKLCEAVLSDADIRGANLSGVDLSGADLCEANLSDANLRGAVLRNTDLSGATLCDADLRGVDLNDANLSRADLLGADFSGADLSYVDFGDVRWKVRPLQILGSRDPLIVLRPDEIRMGCIGMTPDEWLAQYEHIGRYHRYTEAQIREYGEHLRNAMRWLELAEKNEWFEHAADEKREEQ